MEDRKEESLKNISIIKNSIKLCDTNVKILYKIFMIYGVMNCINYIVTVLMAICFESITLQGNINLIVSMFMYLFFSIYFIKIYRSEILKYNKYYRTFLNLWISIAIIFPILIQLTKVCLYLFDMSTDINSVIVQLFQISILINMLLFVASQIITGEITNKPYIKYISIIIVFIYLLIFVMGRDVQLVDNIRISQIGIYYYLLTSIGYIVLSLILKSGEKNEIK